MLTKCLGFQIPRQPFAAFLWEISNLSSQGSLLQHFCGKSTNSMPQWLPVAPSSSQWLPKWLPNGSQGGSQRLPSGSQMAPKVAPSGPQVAPSSSQWFLPESHLRPDGPSLNWGPCSREALAPILSLQAHTHGGGLPLNLEPAAKGEQPQRSWLLAARWNLGAFGG